MKTRKILLASALVCFSMLGGLTSCNNGGNTEHVDEDRITITGLNSAEVGSTVQLTATVKNDNTREGVSWSSSDATIATVDQDGLVTAVAAGSCKIVATLIGDTSVSKEFDFTVTPSTEPSVSIVVSKTIASVGESITLEANVYNPKNKVLTYSWKTSNGVGVIKDAKKATASISASVVGDEIVTLTVQVGQTPLVSTVSLYFKDNYSTGYTEIDSAEKFKSTFLTSGVDASGKYCLTNDIDLGGLKVNGATLKNKLSGTLDGRGYTVSNFEVVGNLDKGYYPNTGLIFEISGTLRNLSLVGTLNKEGIGWGSSILTNTLSGTVTNCSIDVTSNYNQGSDEWFPFAGAICGVLNASAKVVNNVVNVTGEGQGGVMAIAAYPAGGVNEKGTTTAQAFTVSGVYTNQTSAACFGSSWEWGGPITIATDCETDLVFGSTEASTYTTLNDNLWNLVDNQIPTLKTL